MSRLMTKPAKWHVRPAKTQISLDTRPVWSESSLSAWRNIGPLTTYWAHSEDADQNGRMPRLIWVFAGCTDHLLVLSWITLCFSSNSSYLQMQDTELVLWGRASGAGLPEGKDTRVKSALLYRIPSNIATRSVVFGGRLREWQVRFIVWAAPSHTLSRVAIIHFPGNHTCTSRFSPRNGQSDLLFEWTC